MEEKKKTVFADLGQKGYREVWGLQERLLEKVKAEKAGNKIPENHLLFVEHDPVYTLGKSGNEANMLISAIQLRAKLAEALDRLADLFDGHKRILGICRKLPSLLYLIIFVDQGDPGVGPADIDGDGIVHADSSYSLA